MVKIKTRKRKRSTAVVLDYHDAGGRRIRKAVGTAKTDEELAHLKQEAEREARKIGVELDAGKHRPKIGQKSIDEALLEFDAFHQKSTARERPPRQGRSRIIWASPLRAPAPRSRMPTRHRRRRALL